MYDAAMGESITSAWKGFIIVSLSARREGLKKDITLE